MFLIIAAMLKAPVVWAENMKISVMVPLTGAFARYGVKFQEASLP